MTLCHGLEVPGFWIRRGGGVGPLFVVTQTPNTCQWETTRSVQDSPYQYLNLDGMVHDQFGSPAFMIGLFFTFGLSPVTEHMEKRHMR